MKKTDKRVFSRDGEKYAITAKFGLQKIGDQEPYFSVTGEIVRKVRNGRWVDDAGGCIHDEVVKFFPKLKSVIKWHLCSESGPLHYLANSKHWFGIGEYSERNIEYFKSTCVYGALPEDAKFDPEKEKWPVVEAWLIKRLPALVSCFKKEIGELGVA